MAIALLLALLLPSSVFAQTTTGSIKGEIVDQSDEPMAEVKLTLTGENLIGLLERRLIACGLYFIKLPSGIPVKFCGQYGLPVAPHTP